MDGQRGTNLTASCPLEGSHQGHFGLFLLFLPIQAPLDELATINILVRYKIFKMLSESYFVLLLSTR